MRASAYVVLQLATLLPPALHAQPRDAKPNDPRHFFDRRCPAAATLDPAGQVRDPGSVSAYLRTPMASGQNTVHDCAELCCHDWSCEAFAFCAAGAEHLCEAMGGKEGVPVAGSCAAGRPCCVFKDDASDPLIPAGSAWRGLQTGRRSMLPATDPPYPNSTSVPWASIEPRMYVGVNGDEFPTTWARDGAQYTGAGDNKQATGGGTRAESPLSFFKVSGRPTEMGCTVETPSPNNTQPSPICKNITMQGESIVVRGPAASKACPGWHDVDGRPVPNLKSSGVLAIGDTIYWAVSCFNYGDDQVFNRQRYGPAWIITSRDGGVTFNSSATPTGMFPGRLAAPRFLQFGRDYAGAPEDGRYVYVYFPGTQGDSAFFENNDQILLGRVPTAKILQREAYEFYYGRAADDTVQWTSDASIATHVWEFPLMTSVQQVNFHPGLRKYVFANWAWISYDGNPRPDHTADERNERTGHQRTQLTLVEGDTPWGPWSVFYRDDNWHGPDGSMGGCEPHARPLLVRTHVRRSCADTPVFPPAWIGDGGGDDFWMVYTQCCGNPRPPWNHYNFNAQKVVLR